MKIVNQVLTSQKHENIVTLTTNACEIQVLFLTEDIVRIRTGFDGEFKEGSYSLTMTGWEDRLDDFLAAYREKVALVSVAVTETEAEIVITSPKLIVKVQKEQFQLSIYNQEGQLLHADIVDLALIKDSNSRRIHTSEIFEGDHFYGFGEKTGEINKRNKFMKMSPRDTMGYNPKEADSLYKHIPFYVKLNDQTQIASGYFYHTTYECDFDMGREHSNYWKKHSQFRVDGGEIDLFFIAGPSVKEVVERYTDLTGKSYMLPRYALGYLGSSMYYSELPANCDQGIIDFVDTAKGEDIPIDGFQLSSGYCALDNKRYVFTWNNERFADPASFFTEMEKRGVGVSPNVKPGLLLSHPHLEALQAEDIFVKASEGAGPVVGTWWGGKGVFADFTKPHTRKVWKEYLNEHLLEYGVRSIWNDNCEYDSIVDKDARVDYDGEQGTIGQLKSVMSNIMCQISIEAIQEKDPNTRAFIVCRSGHAGIQRYAQSWAGDNYTSWDSLKYNMSTILGMAVSGVTNFGCDIGGFYGPAPEEELFVRWVQNGIFQPRFSIHSTNTDNTVTEPWMYAQSQELIRETIQFRYQMIPLYYSLMARAHQNGLPIIQPMFMAFQADPQCYDNGVDFVVGDTLLVANVVEKGQTVRDVYLPAGHTYYDFYTRERYAGGQVVSVPVTLDTIPMFIIGGSILPLAQNKITNHHHDVVEDLHVIITPDTDSQFTLYEDDGISMEYQAANYLQETISVTAGEIVTVNVAREGRYQTNVKTVLLDIVHTDSAPFWLMLGEEVLPNLQTRKNFEASTTGWYYSKTLRSVLVKFANPATDYTVTVSFENFDMLGM